VSLLLGFDPALGAGQLNRQLRHCPRSNHVAFLSKSELVDWMQASTWPTRSSSRSPVSFARSKQWAADPCWAVSLLRHAAELRMGTAWE
jgi:hypothetical protein